MVDVVTPEVRSRMMAGIKGKNTKPEIFVRKLLHAQGFRFRLNRKDLPGKPDIVLAKYKTVIFVHGCFWHGHQDCHLFRIPKSREDFWEAKLASNATRDAKQKLLLLEAGWRTLYVWECAIKGKTRLDPEVLGARMTDFLRDGMKQEVVVRGGSNSLAI